MVKARGCYASVPRVFSAPQKLSFVRHTFTNIGCDLSKSISVRILFGKSGRSVCYAWHTAGAAQRQPSASPTHLPFSTMPAGSRCPNVPRCGTWALGSTLFWGTCSFLSPQVSLSQACHWLTIPQLAVSLAGFSCSCPEFSVDLF